jgi:hypothetical protein
MFDYPALVRHRRVSVGRRVAIAPNKRGIVDRRIKAVFLENSSGDAIPRAKVTRKSRSGSAVPSLLRNKPGTLVRRTEILFTGVCGPRAS